MVDHPGIDRPHRQQRAKGDGVLVGGSTAHALDTKRVDEVGTVEQTVDDVRVADVDGQKHPGGAAYHRMPPCDPCRCTARASRWLDADGTYQVPFGDGVPVA